MPKRIKNFLFQNTSFKQTVAKNSFRLLVSEFVARLFTFLIGLWIARELWKSEFWVYNYVITFITFFVLIIDFWLTNLSFRELSKNSKNASKYLTNVSFIKWILSVITLIIILVLSRYNDNVNSYSTLIILYLLYSIVASFLEFFRIFFRSEEKMEHEASLKIWNNLILFICTIIFLYFDQSVKSVFYWYLVSSIINLITSLIYIKKFFHFEKSRLDIAFMKNILRMSIPFFLWWVFAYFYSDVIIVLIEKFKWESDVWLFSAPYKLLSYVYILFNVFSMAMFTKLVASTKDSMDRFSHLIKKFAYYHLLLSVVCCIWFIVLAKFILNLLYWAEFTDANTINIMKILSIILIFKSLSYVFGNALTAMSKEYTRLYVQVFIAIINVSCALYLIPKYWINWAAYSLIIAECCIMIWYWLFTKYHIKWLKKLEKSKQ